MPSFIKKQKRSPYRDDAGPDPDTTTIAIGAEAANVIQVTITLRRPRGQTLARVFPVTCVLADLATTGVPVAAAPSGGVAVGVGTQLGADIAGKVIRALPSAAGVIRLDITEAGAKTLYVHVFLPNGRVKVSSAVTFV